MREELFVFALVQRELQVLADIWQTVYSTSNISDPLTT